MTTITINNWTEFNPRKDRKKHHWFRVDNTIPFSRALDGLGADQKWLWICLLAFVSEKEGAAIEYDIPYFEKHVGITRRKMDEALAHLAKKGVINLSADTITDPPGDRVVTDRCPTDVRTNVRTNERTDERTNEPEFGPRELANIWNDRMQAAKRMNGKPMPMVDVDRLRPDQDRWKMAKARIVEEPNPAWWADVIDRIARSEFCRGKGARGDWVANFDFAVRPKTAIGVMEDQYGCSPRRQFVAAPVPERPPEPDLTPEQREANRRKVHEMIASAGNLGRRKAEGA